MSLIRTLSQKAEIQGIVVSDLNGEVDFYDGNVSPDTVASVSAVAVHEMTAVASLIGKGKFSYMILQGATTTIVACRGEKIASAVVDARTDGKEIIEVMEKEKWEAPPKQTQKIRDDAIKQAGPPASKTQQPPPPMISSVPKKTTQPPSVSSLERKAPSAGSIFLSEKKISSTNSIPPTPEAYTLKNLRLSLFRGDILGTEATRKELTRLDYPGNSDWEKTCIYGKTLDVLTAMISKLIAGSFDTQKEIESFLIQSEKLEKSIRWAALVWQTRLCLTKGDTEAATEAALAAYHIAHEFDSDTRTVTRCTISDVYIMDGEYDKALTLLQSGKSIAQRCQTEAVAAVIWLTESHALAMKNLYFQSKDAAKKAEKIQPHSPYPKLMLARLSILRRELDQAKGIYSEILKLNANQADALADLEVIHLIESGKLSQESASFYFTRRESAPTVRIVMEMIELLHKEPDFEQLRSLIAWRLLGREEIKDAAALFSTGKKVNASHQFKPHIVIGYGSCSLVVAGYQSIMKRMEAVASSGNTNAERDPAKPSIDAPMPYLSLAPDKLQEMMDNGSSDNLFSGELKMFSMPDLLEFLRAGRRTGSLICSSVNGVGAVELTDGFISSAIVPDGENIGSLLVKKGKIAKGEITKAVSSQHKDLGGTRIGAILVEKGLVDAESVKSAIIEQTFSAIRTMLTWADGRFAFTPAMEQDIDHTFIEVKLDSQYLLMELYREIDEKNRK